VISDSKLSILQLSSGENVFRHVSVQMVGTLNTFCEHSCKKNCIFSCVFGSNGFRPLCDIFAALMLDGDMPSLTAKI